jgi:hypothetical protein
MRIATRSQRDGPYDIASAIDQREVTRHSRRRPPNTPRALRIALPIVAALSIVAPLAWLWQDSRVPAAYSVMDMGYPDYGMGAIPEEGDGGHGGHMQGSMAGHQMAQPRVVTDMIVDPARPADVRVDLVTRQKMLTVGGRSVPGFTVNRTSPGLEIRALQGQLIECTCGMSRSPMVSHCTGTVLMYPTPWTGWPG